MSRREHQEEPGRTYSESDLATYLQQAADWADKKLAEQRVHYERRIAGLEKHCRRELANQHERHQRVLDRLLRDLQSMADELRGLGR